MSDFALFVSVIAVLIIGHELGHFLAAKLTGVEVEEFGLGFPPRLLTLFHYGETRFSLNLIPLGGFVRPKGEDDPKVPNGLAGASKRVRSLVLLAGPAANVLLAFLAFSAAFKFAAPDPNRVLITGIASGSPAETAGIRTGDIVTAIDGREVDGFESLQAQVTEHLGNPVRLALDRNGQIVEVELVPRPQPPEGEGPIGVILGHPTRQVGMLEALQQGARSTWIQFREILRLPARMLAGEVEPEDARVSGLKGMYDMLAWAGEIDQDAQRPFLTLNLVGVISVSLALANLLPIPALDGGRLMFVVIEAILGRRIAPRYEGLAHLIGFALLLLLMVYINLQDFVNPITIPR